MIIYLYNQFNTVDNQTVKLRKTPIINRFKKPIVFLRKEKTLCLFTKC